MSGVSVRPTMRDRQKANDAIFVTGAAGGIGAAIVRRLLKDGWMVVAADLNEAALGNFTEDKKIIAQAINVAEHSSVQAAAKSLKDKNIGIAGLVNAAGILQDILSLSSMDEAQQRRVWDVNYFGAMHCIQIFGAEMAEKKCGSIVNITSINETRPLPLYAYAPAKAALGSLTVLSAGEFGPHGVRVNSVAPGFTLTPALDAKIKAGLRDVKAINRHTAMGRLVQPDEIAAVTSFLISDDASAITGASLPVDGGWLASSHWMNYRELQH